MQRTRFLLLALIISISIFFISGCAAKYEVNVEVEPQGTGEIEGEGTYEKGEEVILKAEPGDNYVFVSWEENGEEVSSKVKYQFKIAEDKELVANFIEKEKLAKDRIEEELSNNWKIVKEKWRSLMENKHIDDELKKSDFKRTIIHNEDKKFLNVSLSPGREKVAFLWEGDISELGHAFYTLSGYYDVEKDEVHFISLLNGEVGANAKPLWSLSGEYFAYVNSKGPGSPTTSIVIEGVEGRDFIIGSLKIIRLQEKADYIEVAGFDKMKPRLRELKWAESGNKLYFTKAPGPATPPEMRKTEYVCFNVNTRDLDKVINSYRGIRRWYYVKDGLLQT